MSTKKKTAPSKAISPVPPSTKTKRVPPSLADFNVVFGKLTELMRLPETRRLIEWVDKHGLYHHMGLGEWLYPYAAANDLAQELGSLEEHYDFELYDA